MSISKWVKKWEIEGSNGHIWTVAIDILYLCAIFSVHSGIFGNHMLQFCYVN